MLAYTLRRLAVAIPVLLGIAVVTYGLVNLAPGDPVQMLVNPLLSEEAREAIARRLGLDQPIWIRFIAWFGELLRGNLGFSFSTYQPVLDTIAGRLPATVELMGSSLLVAYVIGIPVGIFVAVRRYSWSDYLVTVLAFVGISTPTFFMGLLLIYVFALQLNWLPAAGIGTIGGGTSLLDHLAHLVLPASVLALNFVASTVRYVRGSMLEVLGQDYIRTARSKGLREGAVLAGHALRNALLPIITVAGLQVPQLFAGAVITEQVFGWPGIGQLAISAIGARDYPTVMAITMISAVLVVVGNLLADLLYAIADPRVRMD